MAMNWATATSAHGLNATTANVVVRNRSHVMLYLQYDPLRLLSKITKRNNLLAVLSGLPEEALEKEYQHIKNLLQKKLVIRYNQQTIVSPNFRFPELQKFSYLIREQFMDAVTANQKVEVVDHAHKNRSDFQILEVDGFLPKNSAGKILEASLDIHFPRELGTVIVTYSEPLSQTVKPGKNGSHYRHRLNADK